MDATITHFLDGTEQARDGGEIAVKAWTRRSLTLWMEWDKQDTVVRRL